MAKYIFENSESHKKVFISVPYSENPERGIDLVNQYISYTVVDPKTLVVAPILYGHAIIKNARYKHQERWSYEDWQTWTCAYLDDSIDELHVITLDTPSKGQQAEIEKARELRIPIVHVTARSDLNVSDDSPLSEEECTLSRI